MRILIILLGLKLGTIFYSYGQADIYQFAVSDELPYGKLNPAAPKQVGDYAELIGKCNCKSYIKNKEGDWGEAVDMEWTFRYIMNGTAVEDKTLKEDGSHAGSIRQYHADSARWYVHYYSKKRPSPKLTVWEGGKVESDIVLYSEQKAPNGTDGYYKIRFYDISNKGFKWLGVWTTLNENFTLETWKINCIKSQ